MKLSERWIRELAAAPVDARSLADSLTMAGVMVDAVVPAAPALTGIVVGRVTSVARHPDADKLTVCTVDAGERKARTIVCGATNVRAGLNAPVALPGTALPDGTAIAATALRGVTSEGMLCSARELGLGDDHDGLLELPADARPGAPLIDVLALDDNVFEFDITPNRGDCLSALGIAREVAAVHGLPAPPVPSDAVVPTHDAKVKVSIDDVEACPVYCGRLVRGVDTQRPSPVWLQERLRRAGIRPLGAAVDVTAYVMLELGQPMHAFDHAKLRGGITVRRARDGETLEMLDGRTAKLTGDVLVIADDDRPVAMAGVMGGLPTAVGEGTRDVFLESAHFAPLAVVNRARRYGLHTDASQRFERGVDPSLPLAAIERATRLLVDIAGGESGPVVTAGKVAPRLRETRIALRRARVARLLGVAVPDAEVVKTLQRLGCDVRDADDGWSVAAPAHRFDLEIEADLIEEVARLHGYERIPVRDAQSPATMLPASETRITTQRLADTLVQRGFQQVITYSFVDPALHRLLGVDAALPLENPIAADLAEMRTGLWPGLIGCLRYNVKRQQTRVHIFEHGLRFILQDKELSQEKVIAGLLWGDRVPEQWGLPAAKADFYDAKGACEALVGPGAEFAADRHAALHPGQSARVRVGGRDVGWIGALHPRVMKALDVPGSAYVFELAVDAVTQRPLPVGRPVSRFPGLRRDLALVVPEAVTVGQVLSAVDEVAPNWLETRFIFDIYRGKGIEPGLKSIALGLILQETSRTLTDDEVEEFLRGLVSHLGSRANARLRD